MRAFLVAALAVVPGCLPCAALEFRLVDVPDTTTLERRLNRAAEGGFDILASAVGQSADGKSRLVALLGRHAGGEARPDRFRVLTSSGELQRQLPAAIRALTESSFRVAEVITHRLPDRWLPEGSYEAQVVWILERAGEGRGQRYALLSLSAGRRTEQALSEQPLAARRLLAGRRRVHLLLGGEEIDRVEGDAPYRVLIEARRHQLRRKLTRASKQGYVVVDAVASTVNAPPVMLLERRATVRPRVYRILADPLELHRRGRLAETLELLAREGYELVPQTLDAGDWVATRPAGRRDRAAAPRYRLISSRAGDLATLAQAATLDGFDFEALITAPAETMILMLNRDRRPD